MEKIRKHLQYIYITLYKLKPSHAMTINTRLNNKVDTIHNFQHVIKIEALKKITFNYKKIKKPLLHV